MTDLREELARAICSGQGCTRGKIGLGPCVQPDGRNAPCQANAWQLNDHDRSVSAILAIIDRLTAAAQAEEREKVAAHFDGLRMLRQMWTAEQAAAAIRAMKD